MCSTNARPDETPQLPENAEGFLAWLAVEKGYANATLEAYRDDLVAFERFLAGRGLSTAEPKAIGRREMQGFLAEQHRLRQARSSMGRRLSCLRGFFKHLIRRGALAKSPLDGLANPKLPRTNPKSLNVDQAFALLDSAPQGGDPVQARDKALAELLYGSGLRVSEALGLKLNDVDANGGLARVTGKGSKERLAPLSDTCRQALAAYMALRHAFSPLPSEQSLFLGLKGKPLQRRQANRILEGLSLQAGLPVSVNPHALRHSFASHMLQSGADMRAVQELLGHSRLSTTQRYTHLNLDQITRAYDKAHPRSGTGEAEGHGKDASAGETLARADTAKGVATGKTGRAAKARKPAPVGEAGEVEKSGNPGRIVEPGSTGAAGKGGKVGKKG
ncbi:Tyrosine recombinase XerD [Fundidesulfovibrio magnetotacticus]|uniref:Tyrosine recombinase XerC n=1 Tax=Fundidesulfovibrio magnetotacticus TaxID=2730080 RepID=A0A6V8LSS9_9BACT|nr:tyrosine recombinase XerC [Fundidesulfovibrio magnetotacticus]GFK95532.1 Tyrosine recombinase XerD [Fundidesulfovibrio magnetotacticus]